MKCTHSVDIKQHRKHHTKEQNPHRNLTMLWGIKSLTPIDPDNKQYYKHHCLTTNIHKWIFILENGFQYVSCLFTWYWKSNPGPPCTWGKALRQLSYSSMGPICEVHGAKHTVLGTVVHTVGIQKVCAEWKNQLYWEGIIMSLLYLRKQE